MYEEHARFIQWASEYDDGDVSMRSRAMHDEWQKLIECRHITLSGTQPIERLLEDACACFVPIEPNNKEGTYELGTVDRLLQNK